ncbi:EpsG family protein [Parazoarcus communis]|uniref:EpsG family protein n=1 Tax=Parazoarcus communis SWub3 = DSM 12120 TaxID=1121029 RepID=A0A323UQ65_9RHOO|nr:EpsG family protein [Parazoarcus communis]PZA14477.1 hypothetical protein DNK49_21600 [Azoarcus communis] [Parazoarcus communis SWub3 = DSM 12120]
MLPKLYERYQVAGQNSWLSMGRVLLLVLVGISLSVLGLISAAMFPVLPALLSVLVVFVFFGSKRTSALGAVLMLCLFLGWMNGEKSISGDWGWYTIHHKLLSYMSIWDYLGSQFGNIKIKTSEPVFHFISYALANITGGDPVVLAWVVTFLIYGLCGLALAVLLDSVADNSIEIVAAVLAALAVGITFTLTTQLVRQEIATAFIVLGFVTWTCDRRNLGFFLIALGVLTHNSSIIPVGVVAVAIYFARMPEEVRAKRLVLVLPVFILLGFAFVRLAGGGGYYTIGKSDGAIAWYVHVFDLVVFMAFAFLYRRITTPEVRFFCVALLISWLMYVSFLVGTYSEPLPFLRMYFYMESMRMLMIAVSVLILVKIVPYVLSVPVMLVMAVLYVEARLMTSPFWYKGGVIMHFIRPFAFFN